MYVMHQTCPFCQTSKNLHTNLDQWLEVCQKRLHSKTFEQGSTQKSQHGAVGFKEKVVKDTPIGRRLTKMGKKT